VPLYRSARFLENIEANLDALATMSDVEILVSDRHGLDDTLDRIRARHGTDPRFQFHAATDGIDWVAHFNWLIRQGRGKYFGWMPHDDIFPPGYHAGLVGHLDSHPDTLLAFGPMIAIDEENRKLPWLSGSAHPPPWHTPGRWSFRHAFRVLEFQPWVPVRGVFRRQKILRAGLTIRPCYRNQSADAAWMFGVGLHGPIRFVPTPACVKRYYPESTYRRTMPFSFRSMSGYYAALAWYVIHYSRSVMDAVVGLNWLALAYVFRIAAPPVTQTIAVRTRLRQAWQWIVRQRPPLDASAAGPTIPV